MCDALKLSPGCQRSGSVQPYTALILINLQLQVGADRLKAMASQAL